MGMGGLSLGQKVKVVIAAAMWNNPHILVLDEPTNYLDRDSLAALAHGITTFGGGVVVILTTANLPRPCAPRSGVCTTSRTMSRDRTGTLLQAKRRLKSCSPPHRLMPSVTRRRSRHRRRSCQG